MTLNFCSCQTECTDGMYGPNCQMPCGNCANSAVCDKINGSCPDGCMAGYQEPLCVEGKYFVILPS